MEIFLLFLISSHWRILIALVFGLSGATDKANVFSVKPVEVGVDRQCCLLALVMLLLTIQLDSALQMCVSWVFGENLESGTSCRPIEESLEVRLWNLYFNKPPK